MSVSKVSTLMAALIAVAMLGCEKSSDVAQIPANEEAKKLPPPAISEKRPSFMETQPFALGGKCNMETVNEVAWGAAAIEVDANKPLLVTGWAVDEERKMVPKDFSFRIQDGGGKEYYVPAKSVDRPEVAEYFKEAYFLKSGYTVEADIQSLPLGSYAAMIVMDVGGKSVLCASGRSFVAKGGAQ